MPIKYTNRDFNSIKSDLVEYAKRYYPNDYKDFSQASFGSLMLDTVAYVGDMLSFYIDYQANESFLDTAYDYNNVLRHGKSLGYKHSQSYSTYGIISLYILVPASTSGIGPDTDYLPLLRKGSLFISSEGAQYSLNQDVDFGDADATEIVVAKANAETGVPSWYAVKAHGQIISGLLAQEIIPIGNFQRFLKIKLETSNIIEVVSVVDSEGHEYFEVDHLSQNVIYRPVINRNTDKNDVLALLKPFIVPRRYVMEQDVFTTSLKLQL